MTEHPPPIGPLFPLGGPVPRELIVGRAGEIDEIAGRLPDGLSTLLVGPRRIGKTTVCKAACEVLAEQDFLVVQIDVPERRDSDQLLQEIVNGCGAPTTAESGIALARLVRPALQRLLADLGLPLDLSAVEPAQRRRTARAIMELPIALAKSQRRRAIVFFDELQRVVDYEDGKQVLTDLIDLYAGSEDAVVLVDGSEERTLRDLLGPPHHLGKLVDRLHLPETISTPTWRAPLSERFERAGLRLPDEQRDALIAWGANRPYDTMAIARYTARAARKTQSDSVTDFDVQMGIDEARRHLDDDGT